MSPHRSPTSRSKNTRRWKRRAWLDGVVYDMSGGTLDHAGLAMSVGRLVGQDQRRIEVFRKNEEGLWVLVAEAGAGESATLASIGCTLQVDEVYADPLAEPG